MGTGIETFVSIAGQEMKIGDKTLRPRETGTPALFVFALSESSNEVFAAVIPSKIISLPGNRTAITEAGDIFMLYDDEETYSPTPTKLDTLNVCLRAEITNVHEKPAIPDNL